MCTLTIIPFGTPGFTGFRFVTNRDESRRRPAATPPEIRQADGVRAMWPVDTGAGGTWIAAGEHGLVLSILNLNLSKPPATPPGGALTTRGAIIPALIGSASAAEALDRLAAAPLDQFAPFRLIAADSASVFEARWDRSGLAIDGHPLTPLCFVSSGLGDQLVEPRIALFRDWFRGAPPTAHVQDAFHRHSWPDRPEISVRMNRADARTVSTTVVESQWSEGATHVAMTYIDDADSRRLELFRRQRSLAGASVERV